MSANVIVHPAGARLDPRAFNVGASVYPSATANPPNPARVPIPRAGSYDVEAHLQDPGAVFVQRAVQVAAGQELSVHIQLPARKPITFVLDDPKAVVGSHLWSYFVEVRSLDSATPAAPEGCSVRSISTDVELRGPGPFQTRPLPLGCRYRVQPSTYVPDVDSRKTVSEWPSVTMVPDREIVEAGGTVHLGVAPVAWLRLHVLSTSPQLRFSNGFYCSFCIVQGHRRRQLKDWIVLDSPAFLLFPAKPGSLDLTWSGAAVAKGHIEDLDLTEGAVTDVKVDLSPAPPAGPELNGKLHVTVTPGGTRDGNDLLLCAVNGGGAQMLHQDLVRDEWSLSPRWRAARYVLACRGPVLASDAIPPPAEGDMDLHLRPAGELVVVPSWELSAHLGDLRIQRKDGRPVFLGQEIGLDFVHGCRSETVVNAHAGTILGPLPAGTYVFAVSLGGVPLPDASATVVAGKVEVLRIRR